MKNHVQLNPIIADFKRTDIILLIYKALYFTPPVRIRENIHTPPRPVWSPTRNFRDDCA